MGEVAVSGEDGGVMDLDLQETEDVKLLAAESASATAAVKWERFLPKMVLRVLLVEADDSTRQIIAALLRKCSYKVAAVSDGLKAWEVLKRRPRNVDLILTEVDLPSISGYALLTLIMEHEICKNIPVIMMSARDSISTVYKCMLRGAADFLVKPVRKNELRILWQHVWRRQSSRKIGHRRAEESVVELKVEATAENNGFSNHSSGLKACVERNRECIEKGSDAQSSCTKPALETGEEKAKHIQEFGHQDQNNSHPIDWNHENDPAIMKSPKQAISFLGAFDNYTKCNYVSGSNANKVDSPQLELSLTRYPSGSVNQFPDEKHRLKHSDASAFTRYVSKAVQPRDLISPMIWNEQKDDDYNLVPSANIESGQAETELPSPGQRVLTVPIPVRGVRFDGVSNTSSFMGSSMRCPVSASQQNSPFQAHPFQCLNNQTIHSQQCHSLDQNVNSAITQTTKYKQCFQSEPDRGHVSSTTDQSPKCNGVMNCHYTAEYGNEEVSVVQDGNSQKLQRQAALNKFRLKKKDRCYEKKVRYESRKKLAEQRPRVKGQFVRQLPSEPPPGYTSPPTH